jgi:hypothetical protein
VPSQSSQKTIPDGKLELLLAPPLGELLNGESPEEELSACFCSVGSVSDEQENIKPIAITETAKTKTLFILASFYNPI